jgi:hypothetical protein
VGHRSRVWVLLLGAIAFTGVVSAAEGQRRAPGQERAKQAIQASLKVGGQTYESSEAGSCTHAPKASIYDVMAELWTVNQAAGERSLTLTFWKPANGSGEMFNLSVSDGKGSHNVNTVRGGTNVNTVRGGTTSGSGKVTFEKSGQGGAFIIDAKTKAGAAITGKITCAAFGPHIAEGGL